MFKRFPSLAKHLSYIYMQFTIVMAVSAAFILATGGENRVMAYTVFGVLALLILLRAAYRLLGRVPVRSPALQYGLQYLTALGMTLAVGIPLNWFSPTPQNLLRIAALVLVIFVAGTAALAAKNRQDAERINAILEKKTAREKAAE